MNEKQILDILRRNYGESIQTVEFLRKGGSESYLVRGQDRTYLLKIVGSAFLETAAQAVSIQAHLWERGFPVPAVIPTVNGRNMLERAEQDEKTVWILYEYLEGVEPDIDRRAGDIGALVGRMHKLMEQYGGPLTVRDRDFFLGRYLDILRKKGYPRADIYARLGAELWAMVQDTPAGFCHGDLHRGNLLETADGTIYVLDFDTACQAPRMFDVMVMCDTTNYFERSAGDVQRAAAVLERFAAGYTRHMALPEAECRTFYAWVAIRHFQLQATIVEVHGLDCIDERFLDWQLDWLRSWCGDCGLTACIP